MDHESVTAQLRYYAYYMLMKKWREIPEGKLQHWLQIYDNTMVPKTPGISYQNVINYLCPIDSTDGDNF